MSTKGHKYLDEHSTPLPEVLEWLERETHLRTRHSRMLSGHSVSQLLIFISKILSPTNILEIGTFTGYSAISLAQGLKADGVLDTLEINDELQELILEGFSKAGLKEKINLIVGNALESLKHLPSNHYDMVYIDANKREYPQYYKMVVPLVKSGGVIIADNVLWDGKLFDISEQEQINDQQLKGIVEFNSIVKEDPRVENFILPVRDGLNIIRKL